MPSFDPLGLRSAPADLAHALRAIPELVERLEQVTQDTSVLEDVRAGVQAIERHLADLSGIAESTATIRCDTAALPALGEHMGRVAEAVQALPSIDERMANIEGAMPVLVQVQQHLERLPEAIETLGQDLAKLPELLDRMLVSLDRLDGTVATLQASVEPLGRIANRMPGRGPRAQ